MEICISMLDKPQFCRFFQNTVFSSFSGGENFRRRVSSHILVNNVIGNFLPFLWYSILLLPVLDGEVFLDLMNDSHIILATVLSSFPSTNLHNDKILRLYFCYFYD